MKIQLMKIGKSLFMDFTSHSVAMMNFSLVMLVITRKDCETFQTFGSKHLLVTHSAKTSGPWVQ